VRASPDVLTVGGLGLVKRLGWEAAVLGDVRERNRRLYELNARLVAGDDPLQAVLMAAPSRPAARSTLAGHVTVLGTES
jgi:hypothetical protein